MAAIQYSGLLATPANVRGRKDIYLDGDYSKAQPCGAPVPVFPFLNQGDTETVYFRQKFECAIASYSPLDLTAAMPGVANAYPMGDVNFRDGGCGIWEFERQYGNIPKQRIRRGQSHRYSFQYVLNSGAKLSGVGTDELSYEGPTYTLGTMPFTVDSILQYDFFLADSESDFPLLEAPLVQQIGLNIDPRGQDVNGGAFPLTLSDSCVVGKAGVTAMLAEDDVYSDWLGALRYRLRRTITPPTLAFFIKNLT